MIKLLISHVKTVSSQVALAWNSSIHRQHHHKMSTKHTAFCGKINCVSKGRPSKQGNVNDSKLAIFHLWTSINPYKGMCGGKGDIYSCVCYQNLEGNIIFCVSIHKVHKARQTCKEKAVRNDCYIRVFDWHIVFKRTQLFLLHGYVVVKIRIYKCLLVTCNCLEWDICLCE